MQTISLLIWALQSLAVNVWSRYGQTWVTRERSMFLKKSTVTQGTESVHAWLLPETLQGVPGRGVGKEVRGWADFAQEEVSCPWKYGWCSGMYVCWGIFKPLFPPVLCQRRQKDREGRSLTPWKKVRLYPLQLPAPSSQWNAWAVVWLLVWLLIINLYLCTHWETFAVELVTWAPQSLAVSSHTPIA